MAHKNFHTKLGVFKATKRSFHVALSPSSSSGATANRLTKLRHASTTSYRSVTCYVRLHASNSWRKLFPTVTCRTGHPGCILVDSLSFIAKCQHNCIRNVMWCQVHSSHNHANHKKKKNIKLQQQQSSNIRVQAVCLHKCNIVVVVGRWLCFWVLWSVVVVVFDLDSCLRTKFWIPVENTERNVPCKRSGKCSSGTFR